MAAERGHALREIGEGLARLGLSPLGLVQSANRSAARLVAILEHEFPSYADAQAFPLEDGATPLRFNKRAQLCVSMLHAANVGGGFDDMPALTVFADYRLPQLFRSEAVRILELEPRLASAIDAGSPIAHGSADEVLLRAATVWAAKLVGDALRKRTGLQDLTQAQLDYFLWRMAVKRDETGVLPPFHRTRCTAY